MRNFKLLATAALGLMAFSLFALGTPAQAQRPHYLHALTNLRQARSILQSDTRPAMAGQRDRAIEEIDSAIREVKTVIRDEGRNPGFAPPSFNRSDPDRPMRSALDRLNEAYEDISRGTDEAGNRGLQARALGHIDDARHILRHALHMMEEHGREHRY